MFPFSLFAKWTPASARERLRKGRVPGAMRVAGHLDLAKSGWLMRLPRVVEAASIDVSDCARLGELPEVVRCSALGLQRTHIKSLPAGLNVSRRIDATDCECLREVGALRVPELILRGCLALEKLSDGLQVRHLDLSRCDRLAELPASTAKCLWDLDVSNCQSLTVLPAGLVQLRTLNVRGCTNLRALPNDIRVLSRIEVADSGLESLPESVRSTQIVWQGIRVSCQIAFHPETITVRKILREPNVELRRVMLERVGREWFCENARPQVVDSDSDAGGTRRLLRVPFGEEEDFVCLEVRCPSTGRKYLLRVPPQLSSCDRAAAWLAGFSSARQYRPIVET